MDKVTLYKSLRRAKKDRLITLQQYKTLCGQVRSGDVDACVKGLTKLVNRKKREVTLCGTKKQKQSS